jgi:uncharacterized membrane protein
MNYTEIKESRIESIDILRGFVMVIMALDHARLYFHYGSFLVDPTDLTTTTPLVFFTRFITHFCAAVFVFLSGASAFLYGYNKTKQQLFKFLFTRGVWLIFLEIVVNTFIWTFDVTYSMQTFQVIFAIGFSMICLSMLIYLPNYIILIVGIILMAGHNTLDNIIMHGQSVQSIVWYFLHQRNALSINSEHLVVILYPVIPWIGLMAVGYLFGSLYQKGFDVSIRKQWLLRLSLGCIALFFILRGLNVYGDLVPWTVQETIAKTIMSFFKVTKYPPSLSYIFITIGPALLFLYAYENTKNKVTDFFLVYGRVPLFYYFLHMLVIHLLAVVGILIFGGDWHQMILTGKVFMSRSLKTYGYSLFVVYMVWIAVVLFLYPFCKRYMKYKADNKEKWWLSYL